jgi:hypothetical protein
MRQAKFAADAGSESWRGFCAQVSPVRARAELTWRKTRTPVCIVTNRGECFHVTTLGASLASTEGRMKRVLCSSFWAIFAAVAAFQCANRECRGGDGWYPGYCCDRVDEFFDGSTLCAWRRTWNGPTPLATPLRGYYVPRPPMCCGCYGPGATTGYATCDQHYMPSCMNCDRNSGEPNAAAAPPAVVIVAGPTQFARLGRIANELDTLAPAGSPTRAPAAPAAR